MSGADDHLNYRKLLISRRSRRAETLRSAFNRGLAIIREKGIYNAIIHPREGEAQ